MGERLPTDTVSNTIMRKFDEPTRALLQQIADALGVPVEQFFGASLFAGADEVLHLWSRIRTEAGRTRALEAMRAIVAEEPAATSR